MDIVLKIDRDEFVHCADGNQELRRRKQVRLPRVKKSLVIEQVRRSQSYYKHTASAIGTAVLSGR